MKNKIKEIQDYFKTKIILGEFETVVIEKNVIEIKVDSEFKFALWYYSESDVTQWGSRENSMKLPEFSEEDKKTAYDMFTKIQVKDNDERLNTTKLEQFKKLQSELQEAGVIDNESDS